MKIWGRNPYPRQGKLIEAESLYREALEGRRRQFGAEHSQSFTVIYNLGNLFLKQGKFEETAKLARELIGNRPATDRWHIKGKKLLDAITTARKKKTGKSP